jgi:hypothetical protein
MLKQVVHIINNCVLKAHYSLAVLTFSLLTNIMEQDPSSEAGSRLATQKIRHVLCNHES